jgi:hypothetical protein
MKERRPQLILLALALALFGLTVAGCGGGDDSSLTKAEFIKQADAVCLAAEKEKQDGLEAFLEESGTGPGKPLTPKQQEEMATDAILPPLRTEADELNELDVPDGEEERVTPILEGFDETLKSLEADPEAAATESDPFGKVAKLAGEYGFKTCILNY